jgi:hypothetical protein
VKPKDVDAATFAFPARVLGTLLPANRPESERCWRDLFTRWFFAGLPKDTEFTPKAGIDRTKAMRHISACMRSFEPKHEQKEAGVAYLLSLWFERIESKSGGWSCPPADVAS